MTDLEKLEQEWHDAVAPPAVTDLRTTLAGDALLAELREQNKEAVWIRKKLGVPEDTPFLKGGKDTIAGEMHVVCANAAGYMNYIVTKKCDDNLGQIARDSVTIAALQAELCKQNEIEAAARDLYDNRLGWSDGRSPYSPPEFWHRLGTALVGEK